LFFSGAILAHGAIDLVDIHNAKAADFVKATERVYHSVKRGFVRESARAGGPVAAAPGNLPGAALRLAPAAI